MSPLVTALLCFAAFLIPGLTAKVATGIWMKRQQAHETGRLTGTFAAAGDLSSGGNKSGDVRCRKIARAMKVAREKVDAALSWSQ